MGQEESYSVLGFLITSCESPAAASRDWGFLFVGMDPSLQGFPGLKATTIVLLSPGLKAGASTAVPLTRHLDVLLMAESGPVRSS